MILAGEGCHADVSFRRQASALLPKGASCLIGCRVPPPRRFLLLSNLTLSCCQAPSLGSLPVSLGSVHHRRSDSSHLLPSRPAPSAAPWHSVFGSQPIHHPRGRARKLLVTPALSQQPREGKPLLEATQEPSRWAQPLVKPLPGQPLASPLSCWDLCSWRPGAVPAASPSPQVCRVPGSGLGSEENTAGKALRSQLLPCAEVPAPPCQLQGRGLLAHRASGFSPVKWEH